MSPYRIGFVLMGVVSFLACGPAHTSSRTDQSARVGSEGGDREEAMGWPVGALFPGADAVANASATGAIESITPEELPHGRVAMRVVIAGEADVAERSFLALLPDEVQLPFAVGETISLTIETLPGPPTWQPMNIVVTDAQGALLATHGVTPPDGWQLEIEGVAERVDRGDYDDVECYVSLTHEGQTAVTDRGRWRRLDAPDGAWFVAGSASDVEGDSLPPDGGPSHAILIVRIR